MNYTAKKHAVKIPKNISAYYCDIKRILICTNSFTNKALILKTKLIFDKQKRIIKITREPFSGISNNERKKLKIMQLLRFSPKIGSNSNKRAKSGIFGPVWTLFGSFLIPIWNL